MYASGSSSTHDFPDDLIKLVSLFVEDVTEHLPTSLKNTKPEQWHSLAETVLFIADGASDVARI